jgi:hypothetical protein
MSTHNQIYTQELFLRNDASTNSVKVEAAPTSAQYTVTLPAAQATVNGQFMEYDSTGLAMKWSDVLKASNGTAAAPSLTFQSDQKTGMSTDGFNLLRLSSKQESLLELKTTSALADAYVRLPAPLDAQDSLATPLSAALSIAGGVSIAKKAFIGDKLTVSSGGAEITGDSKITGNLVVTGTTTSVNSANVNIKDSNLFLGSDNTATGAVSGGLSLNVGAVAAGQLVSGGAFASTTTVVVASLTLAVGDFVQVSGSAKNDGLYEVASYATPLLTISSTPSYKACSNVFVVDTVAAGSVTHVNLSQLYTSAGVWKITEGKSVSTSQSAEASVALVGASTIESQAAATFNITKGITNITGIGGSTATLPPIAGGLQLGKSYVVYLSGGGTNTIQVSAPATERVGGINDTSVILNAGQQHVRLTCVSTSMWILG